MKFGYMSSEKGIAETRVQEKKIVGKTKRNPMRRVDGAADAKNMIKSWMQGVMGREELQYSGFVQSFLWL